MFAYNLIEIAERLNMVTQRLVCSENLPECFKNDVRMLKDQAELLLKQTADSSDIEALHIGLHDFRAELDNFISDLGAYRRQ